MELYIITLQGWLLKETILLAIPTHIPLPKRERLAWEQAKFLATYTDTPSVHCLGQPFDRKGFEQEIDSLRPDASYIYENKKFYRYGKDCYLNSNFVAK